MMTLRGAAIKALFDCHQHGGTLEELKTNHPQWLLPARDENPVTWVVVGSNVLFLTRDGGVSLKIKAGKIGVVFHLPDNCSTFDIFDIQELWEEMTGERPRQLMLWADV